MESPNGTPTSHTSPQSKEGEESSQEDSSDDLLGSSLGVEEQSAPSTLVEQYNENMKATQEQSSRSQA